jgi:hypothetical protein
LLVTHVTCIMPHTYNPESKRLFLLVVDRLFSVVTTNPVAQSVQCLTTDRTAGFRSPTEAEDFSSNLCVQTGSGAHPASCTVGTGGSLSGGKARPGRDADHSPPSSAEVKKVLELYLLSPRCASMGRNGTALPLVLLMLLLLKWQFLAGTILSWCSASWPHFVQI